MERILFQIRSLSKAQLKLLKAYLQYFSIRKDPDTQLIKFAEILISCGDEVPTLEECSQLIYGKLNYNAIQKLKSRLSKKIENLILMDAGMEARAFEKDEQDKVGIAIRRKIALFHIGLIKSGSNVFLMAEMEEIIRLSKEFENYSALIEILNYKKWLQGFRKGEAVVHKINSEISFYQNCYNALIKATDAYIIATMRTSSVDERQKRSYQKFLKDSITELTVKHEETRSPMVSYYTKQLEIMYFENLGNIEATRDICFQLLQIIEGNKSVFRKQRVAIVYDLLAFCNIRLGEYDEAILNCKAAQQLFVKNTVNYFISLDYEFMANFYAGNYERCRLLCLTLLKNFTNELGNFHHAKYVLYQANVLFALQKYKDALRVLSYNLQLDKDKLAWDLSIRILRIQVLITLERIDEASREVNSLVRRAERAAGAREIKPREKLILKTMHLLAREGFSGTRIRDKLQNTVSQLKNEKGLHWKHYTSELMPFEKWISIQYRLKK